MNVYKPRVCDAATLLHLCSRADKLEFNRRANTEMLTDDIDLDGINVVQVIVPFHKASMGIPTPEPVWPDHHRCLILFKVKGQSEPRKLWLDVEASRFDELMTEEEMNVLLNDPVAVGLIDSRIAGGSDDN